MQKREVLSKVVDGSKSGNATMQRREGCEMIQEGHQGSEAPFRRGVGVWNSDRGEDVKSGEEGWCCEQGGGEGEGGRRSGSEEMMSMTKQRAGCGGAKAGCGVCRRGRRVAQVPRA